MKRLTGAVCVLAGLLVASVAQGDPVDGTWTHIAQTGPIPPPGLELTALAFDSARQRAVYYAPLVGQTWALDLAGTPIWSQITTTGSPPPTQQCAAFYDAAGDRLIVVGDNADDVWALSLGAATPAWTSLSTPGHTIDAHSSFAYDAAGGRLFRFGGTRTFGTEFTNVIWQYTLGTNTWGMMPISFFPIGRAASNLVYDPGSDRLILHGGIDTPPFTAFVATDETWAFYLSDSTWVQMADGPAMERAGAMFDPTRNRMVVFRSNIGSWAFGLHYPEGWTQLVPDGVMDGGGPGTAAIYDPVVDRMILFGGNGATDTWQLQFDPTTPALASLVERDVTPSRARLAWQLAPGIEATVERRGVEDVWAPLVTRTADGVGRIELDDDSVVPGTRYGYRLEWTNGASRIDAGEVWIVVPVSTAFRVLGVAPNPSPGPWRLSLALPLGGETAIDLFDVRGRRVAEAKRLWLPAGSHDVSFGSRALPAGVYLARVTFGGVRLWTRVVAMR